MGLVILIFGGGDRFLGLEGGRDCYVGVRVVWKVFVFYRWGFTFRTVWREEARLRFVRIVSFFVLMEERVRK